MREILLFVLVLGCGVATPANENTVPAPSGAAPQFFVVGTVQERAITFTQIQVGGVKNEKIVRLKDMIVQSADGKVLAQGTWRAAMVKGAVVVLASDDQPVDPAYMRVLQANTYIITSKNPPFVELFAPSAGVGADAGKVIFRWKATGTDLDTRPISVFYAEKADGPWRVIAERLENSGKYAWTPPPGLPAAVFLRITANEKDGTAVRAQTDLPVVLEVGRDRKR